VIEEIKTKLLVVGGGPGGYVAAIRAGQLGIETVLVEADRLGGTCLIRGCIPSKALIHVAAKFHLMTAAAHRSLDGISIPAGPTVDLARTVAWKETVVDKLSGGVAALLKRAKVRVVDGWATFTDAKTCTVETKDGSIRVTAENVILAAGSVAAELRQVPFGGDVISSTEALSLQELPRRLVVVGAGYIGLELGSAFRNLGCEVTVVEAEDRILPLYDDALTKPVRAWLQKAGVAVHLSARATAWEDGELVVEKAEDGAVESLRIPADKVLVTVGRRPRTSGWGLEEMGVDLAGGFVRVNARMQTSMSGVYAIGDLVGEPMLEHKAAAQAHVAAEVIAGQNRSFNPRPSPRSASPSRRSFRQACCPAKRKRPGTNRSAPSAPSRRTAAPCRWARATAAASFAWSRARPITGWLACRRWASTSPSCQRSSPSRSRWARAWRT
jgi:dihydrolipoamide dehydrogenase